MTKALIIQLDPEYKILIKELKTRVRSAQLSAALAVNQEQIKLYWELGSTILRRQQVAKWGSKLLEEISRDLIAEFPGAKGFSRSNLHYMKQFAEIYPDQQFVQQPVGQLPWGHLILILQRVKENSIRNWYANQAIQYGWSRNVLSLHIKQELFLRQGQENEKLSNFKERLPAPQSELAQQLLKSSYEFSFLSVDINAKEREIEQGLLEHVRDFLLQLGSGFAFVGNQYHLEVGEQDFYIDLLLFNIKLNSYVVCELKATPFKPEYTGKLSFYLSVVDDLIKEPHHNPTIGLLLCEEKNKVVAEYALKNISAPMGVSDYELSRVVPRALQSGLPAVEIIEEELTENLKPIRETLLETE